MSCILALSLCSVAFANDYNDENIFETSYELPSSTSSMDSTITPRAHDMESKREVVGTYVDTKRRIGFAGGQPANGVVMSDGYIYYVDSGNEVPISITCNLGKISVGISSGYVSNSVTGYSVRAIPNTPCKLVVYKDITVTKYAVYERLAGSDLPWKFVHYVTFAEPTRLYLEAEAV